MPLCTDCCWEALNSERRLVPYSQGSEVGTQPPGGGGGQEELPSSLGLISPEQERVGGKMHGQEWRCLRPQ